MRTVIGFDVGTQSTKAIVYDPDSRRVVARAQAKYGLISGDDGTRAQKPGWWIDAMTDCCSAIGKETLKTVAAVGVSGQQHGFVPADGEGRALADARLWCDTATAKECEEIEARAGGRAKLVASVGNPILPGYTVSKILRLKKDIPDAYGKMRLILLPHDYVNMYLTGRASMEYGDASGTGFLSIKTRTWSREVLKAVDPDRDLLECLPPFTGASEASGRVNAKAAADTGLPAGIPVSSGGGDNMMGAIGTGNVREGVLTVSLGTSGTLYAYSGTPILDPEGNFAAFCSSTNGWLPLVCTMNCTVATEILRETFGSSVRELDELAAKAKPGAAGLSLLPFFNGERTPNLPRGKGCLMGITAENATRENIYRAAMESAVFGLKSALGSLERLGLKADAIRLTGGGAMSPIWRRIAADAFGLTVIVPEEPESACFGAALQALWCLESGSGKSSIEKIAEAHVRMKEGSEVEPGQDRDALAESFARYEAYLAAVRPLFE